MNPFNQSRFRNEYELGSAYQVVSEVHSQLDLINFLAKNLNGVRSGNIELKSDDTGKIYWKYVKSDEWILWGDMTEWFTPLLESIQQNINDLVSTVNQHAININQNKNDISEQESTIGNLGSRLIALENSLATLESTLSNLQDSLEPRLTTIESDILSIQNAITDVTTRLEILENG